MFTKKAKTALVAFLATTIVCLLASTGAGASTSSEAFPYSLSRQAHQAVFTIKPYTPEKQYVRAGGTGFLLAAPSGKRFILTNRHVCESIPGGTHFMAEQRNYVAVVTLVKLSTDTDLCLLKPSDEIVQTRKPYALARGKPAPGESVAVFGHPYLRSLTLAHGSYLSEMREPMNINSPLMFFDPKYVTLIGRVDFMIHPGNSGSPLLNKAGDVVGIMFAMETGDHSGLFIPVSEIRKFLQEVEKDL